MKKVLAVEDDPVALTVLENSIRSLGYDVVSARDGEAGWTLQRERASRIVVSDWTMPRLNGLDLCRRIRSHPGDYVYFILLTNVQATNENRDRAMEAGVDDFLSKPIDLQDLGTRLRVATRILQYTTRIEKLESLIPICSYCKNVRNDQSYWQRIESYLAEKTGADCSHSICPDCYEKFIVPQLKAFGIDPAGISSAPKAVRVPPPGTAEPR
ncbi:response regulator [Opitutaceae bacterium EW11]|nr:response regulator [Opitutaceae bacterium EW11]